MDQPPSQAPRHELPSRTMFAVEYPAYVKDTEKAISMLGGREKLAMDIMEDSKAIELRLRPRDPSSHPLIGDIVATRNILFKVTKRTKKSQLGKAQAEPPKVTADAVAVIDKTVRFRRLANFQFLPAKDDPVLGLMQSIASVDLDAIKSLSTDEQMMAGSDVTRWPIPAPPIDVIGWPMPLGYKEEQARPARSTNNTNNLYQGIVMQFSDKDAPAGPTPQILEGMKSVPTKIQDFVRATMDKYQVISRNAVDIMMKKEQLPYRRANMVMPLCAYVMRTGPWRSCWIRYGYDPRTDPESYKYQVLDMRTMDAKNSQSVHRRTKHDDERQKGSDAPLNALEAGSFLFDEEAVRHGRSGIYQVMHVTVPQINYLIAYPNGRRRTICEESGWFHFPLVRAIRLVTNNLRKMLIEGKENPVDMLKLKKALVASIKKEDEEVEERGLLEEKMESISTGKQSEKLKNLRDTRVEELMGDLAMAQGEEEQGGDAGSDADEINFYNDATFDDFEIYGEDSD